MRIALVGGHGGRSGVPRHIRQLCAHLAPAAERVVVSDVNEDGYDFARDMGLEHYTVPGLTSSLNPFRVGAARRLLAQTLERAGPFDVLWAHARLAVPLCRGYVRCTPDPPRLIVTYHGSPFMARPLAETKAARWFERASLHQTPPHDLVFLSQKDQASFNGLPMARHRCHLIENCSDLGQIPPSNGPEHPTLVMTTRACRQKDLASAARIFAALPQAFRLVLVGMNVDTRARALFHRMVPRDVFERVQFCGPVKDVRPYLVSADGYLLTSRYEGQSIGSLEAFEAGLPVIMPAISGAAEMRANHPLHAIIHKGNVAGSARQIERLIGAFRADRAAHIRRNHAAWRKVYSPAVWGARVDRLLAAGHVS